VSSYSQNITRETYHHSPIYTHSHISRTYTTRPTTHGQLHHHRSYHRYDTTTVT